MGTRGFIGFVADDEAKISYNHFDSYPEELGRNMLSWLHGIKDVEELRKRVADIRLIEDEEAQPSAEEIERLKQYAEPGVDGPMDNTEITSWYQLLRKTQGNPAATVDVGVMIDAADFPKDSLFCEWGYLVDLDRNVFEVYKGFQKSLATMGRWAETEPLPEERYHGVSRFYPVDMVASWPFDKLPDEDKFFEALKEPDEDE